MGFGVLEQALLECRLPQDAFYEFLAKIASATL